MNAQSAEAARVAERVALPAFDVSAPFNAAVSVSVVPVWPMTVDDELTVPAEASVASSPRIMSLDSVVVKEVAVGAVLEPLLTDGTLNAESNGELVSTFATANTTAVASVGGLV